MKIIYNDRIRSSDEDRIFRLYRDSYLKVPATTNHVLVQQTKDGGIYVYYQRWLQGSDGPEITFGYDSFSDGLRDRVIKELKNLKSN